MEVSPLELNATAKAVSAAQLSKAKHKSIKLCIIWQASKKDRQLLNSNPQVSASEAENSAFTTFSHFTNLSLTWYFCYFSGRKSTCKNVNQMFKAVHL